MKGHWSIFGILLWLILLTYPCTAQKIPGAAEMILQEEQFKKITADFYDKTLELRMQYDCFGGFLSGADRTLLLAHSKSASEKLDGIYREMDRARAAIEEYEGNDWDERFGVTGFWRRLYNGAVNTLWHKCRIDYYLAAAMAEGTEREEIIAGIIEICSRSDNQFDLEDALLMRARASALLGGNPKAVEYAEQAVDEVLQRYSSADAVYDRTYFRAAMLKYKLGGKATARELNELSAKLKNSKHTADVELNLELGFLEIRYSPQLSSRLLQEYLKRNPEPKYFVAKTILTHLKGLYENKKLSKESLSQRTPYELSLAIELVLQTEPGEYAGMLEAICDTEGFQRPQLLYAAAVADAESNPLKAIEYYIRASAAQHRLSDPYMNISSVEIAYEGARLGYRLCYEDEKYEQIALRGLAFYCSLAEEKADDEMRYLYAVLLDKNDMKAEALELLQDISNSGGSYAARAKLDLIIESLKEVEVSAGVKETAIDRLAELIGSIDEADEKNKEVKAASARIYCQLMLESGDAESAEIVLRFLERDKVMSESETANFRSNALRIQGKFVKAAAELVPVLVEGDCSGAHEALAILAGVIDRIDDFQVQEGFPIFVRNCRKLTEYCIGCAEQKQKKQFQIVLAELLTLLPNEKSSLDKASAMLNSGVVPAGGGEDIDWIRCNARLLTAREEYSSASKVWSQLCAANAQNTDNRPSWHWWRAKYYQIYCWAKLPETTNEQIFHAVEVLKGTYQEIPPAWEQMLNQLTEKPKAG